MEKLTEILNRYIAVGNDTKDKLLGASFVAVEKNGIIHEVSGGRITTAVDSPCFNIDSSGWIVSMSKIVTAVACMQLVEKDLIKLDDNVRHLIPELAEVEILQGFDDQDKPILEKNSDPITLRQLLSHTSGMTYDMIDPDIQKWSKTVGRTSTTLEQTREGWNTPLRFRPGQSWNYGSGIDWAGQVLEQITGQSLELYKVENIFKPLGMKETTYNREQIAGRLAGRIIECPYRNEDGSFSSGPLPVPENPPLYGGGSGLFSSARDFAAFLQGVLAAGEGQGTLLKKETVDEMFRPQLKEAEKQAMETLLQGNVPFPVGTPMNHGISGAINMEDVPNKRHKGSLTWGGLSNPQWWIDRRSGIAAVLFVNLVSTADVATIKLYDELERALYASLDEGV
ncbi:hypothetical protein FSARC_6791 [Fusarium sarcochroum]|uniref:Beta-lactamase-related domain-containing protein n=1 Tax=Fusarium sarcochroum TaxID=1208366 RepID=A0A8H4TWE0_9HYPO|nr:hypothetical protein FSARC_6791 [Fusarium sarcochroum]